MNPLPEVVILTWQLAHKRLQRWIESGGLLVQRWLTGYDQLRDTRLAIRCSEVYC